MADNSVEKPPDTSGDADGVSAGTSAKNPTPAGYPRRRLVFSVVIVLALVVLLGLGLFAWSRAHNNKAAVNSANAAQAKEAKRHSDVLASAAALEQKGSYAEEAQQLQAYIDSNPPSQYLDVDVIRLASTYSNAKNYDAAIKTYQLALDKYPSSTFAATRGLGFVYMNRGDATGNKDDYRKALDYFNASIKLAKDDPEKTHIVGSDESDVRYLEANLQ